MNPLMSAIGGTAKMNNMQSMMQQIRNIKQMLNGRNPDAVAQMFAQRNPQFAQFQRDTAGKSPQQIAEAYGLDWNMVRQMLG